MFLIALDFLDDDIGEQIAQHPLAKIDLEMSAYNIGEGVQVLTSLVLLEVNISVLVQFIGI